MKSQQSEERPKNKKGPVMSRRQFMKTSAFLGVTALAAAEAPYESVTVRVMVWVPIPRLTEGLTPVAIWLPFSVQT